MNLKQVTEYLDHALEVVRQPVTKITGFMVYATSIQRPGLSKIKISSEIISDNETLGINTGKMPDGTDNVVNAFVYNVVEKLVDNIKDEAMVECVIPKGSIIVNAQGGNAGGPVVAVGTNINDAKGYGIIR